MVNTTDDHDDGVASVWDCTLREAIQSANALGGPHTITFAPNVLGTITLQGSFGDLGVSDSVNIMGPGARLLAVSANTQGNAFGFVGGSNYLSSLTIRDGYRVGSPAGTVAGGGIYVYGAVRLTVADCTISGNNVYGG